MKNEISLNNISMVNDLYKKDKKIYLKIALGITIFLIISNNFLKELKMIDYYNYLNLNIWDGFFYIFSQAYFILFIYVPAILIILNTSKKMYSKDINIRFNRKLKLVLNHMVFKIIITTIINIVLLLSILLLSKVYFKFELTWSKGILNFKDTIIYPTNFIDVMSPMKAFLITFIQINLTIILLDMIRETLIELKGNFRFSNIIISFILLFNYILFIFPMPKLFQKIINYFLIPTFIFLWNHKFSGVSYSNVTIMNSIITLIILETLIISVRLMLNRRMKIIDDI